MSNTAIKLGDTVRGEYHDVPFVGIVRAFDGSGWVYVDTAIVVYGTPRDQIGLAPHERGCLTVVRRANLQEGDVKDAPYDVMGGEYLSKSAVARIKESA